MKYICIVFLFILAYPALGQNAQSSDSNSGKKTSVKNKKINKISTKESGTHEFQLWGGYSFNSLNGIWGKTPDAQLGILGMRYNRKFLKLSDNTLEYVFDLTLYANYEYPEFTEARNRNSISGLGVTPVGFQFNLNDKKNVQPFVKTSGGFLYLEEPFPDERGLKFNFIFELGGGLEFILNSHSSLSVGYRYHHLSNGEIAHINPGIDSNLFYAAITIF